MSSQLLAISKQALDEYIQSLPINNQAKAYITDGRFIEQNPWFYLVYPEIFIEGFNDVSQKSYKKKLPLLNIAGYLFYKSVIKLDDIIDTAPSATEQYNTDRKSVIFSSICHEESIKILTHLFGINSVFWKKWHKRREEYIAAALLDQAPPQEITLAEFEQIADFKSAFGKIAIDACYLLSGKVHKKVYKKLLLSHRYFSIGFQLLDDIIDLEEDRLNPQVNYAYYMLQKDLSAHNINISSIPPGGLKKDLYLYGTAEKLLHLSMNYFQKAIESLGNSNTLLWKKIIRSKQYEAKHILSHIQAYEKSIDINDKLSSQYMASLNEHHTDRTLNSAIDFIKKHQGSDGYWEDFYGYSGLDRVFTTSNILANITPAPHIPSYLNKALTFIVSSQRDKSHSYPPIIVDTKALAMTSLSLSLIQKNSPATDWPQKTQREDGGYARYINQEHLPEIYQAKYNDFQGWLQSQVCVSALCYFYIQKSKAQISKETLQKLTSFLEMQQKPDGLLPSYWWTSPIYATSYYIQGHFCKHHKITSAIRKAIKGLVKLQGQDGSFADKNNTGKSVYTSLVINSLCSNAEIFIEYKNIVRKAVNWLTAHQYDDGSFPSSHAFRSPAPWVLNPEIITEWKVSYTSVVNTIPDDFTRVFATSMAISALKSYNSILAKASMA